MFIEFHAISILIHLSLVSAAPSFPNCVPFTSNFNLPSSVSDAPSSAPFVALSPEDSYNVEHGLLELFLKKPPGEVTRNGRVNDKLADGATVNSTFTLLHGIVTFELSAPTTPGVVTATILTGDGGEIDIEILGGDEKHWQTNVFALSPQDPRPHYGTLNSIQSFPKSTPTINDYHSYSIDWNEERIIWSVDGKAARTLFKEETRIGPYLHFPESPARVQMGIWDASSPAGTCEWAKGPIDWSNTGPMTAFIKRVTVECPYS